MKRETGVTELIANYAANLKYEDLPSAVTEIAKKCILDNLGIMIGASTQGIGHQKLFEVVKKGGGEGESTILGFGGKLAAPMAAFINGGLARGLDYDETFDYAPCHPSDVTVPAALAIADREGNVTGKDFITAVTLGNDIICRLGFSIAKRPQGFRLDWAFNSVFGVFGGTLACGYLLRLNASQVEDALGIALHQASGTFQSRLTPDAMLWNMATGFPAMSAVFAALLAQAGITGGKNSLEGEVGLYKMYFGNSWYRDALTDHLGKRFETIHLSFKPWPGVRYNHSYIDATLQVMREQNISSEDIKKITLFVAGWVQRFCEPIEERRRPKTILQAKYSLPYLVAVAATKGKVLVGDVIPEGMNDPNVLKFVEKINWAHDDRFSDKDLIGPAMVKIELKNGKSYEKQLSIGYGHPQNPISWQDLADKFRDCTSYSARPISKENIEKVIKMIRGLENISNVSEMTKVLFYTP